MKKYSRILTALLAVLFGFSLFAPFSYAESNSYTTNTNFWHWLQQNTNVPWLTNNILPYIKATEVCGSSPDGKHHASSVTGVTHNILGEDGYYTCVCEYCGNEFTSSNRASDAYQESTATLPAQTVTSDGGLIWQATFDDVYNGEFNFTVPVSNTRLVLLSGNNYEYSVYSNEYTLEITRKSSSSLHIVYGCSTGKGEGYIGVSASFNYNPNKYIAPISGVYTSKSSLFCQGNFSGTETGGLVHNSFAYSTSTWNVLKNNSFEVSSPSTYRRLYIAEFDLYLPSFDVIPLSSYNVTTSDTTATYNTGTRAASITGNYGIVNGEGTVTKIDTQNIVNETNNTYYSPTTGQPQSFTDWSYDYSDRSYTLTTETGDTVTVTYGDEQVTINEGDTVSNVYYITNNYNSGGGDNGGGSDTPVTPPAAHTHSYTGNITTAPTCTMTGIRTYTCSCGESYTESVPATGHSWTVKSQVATQYDENGELLTEGYIIYRCSVCGEEYRASSSGSPPVSPGSGSVSGNVPTSGLISGIFGIFWDFLSFMLALFNDFIVGGIRGFLAELGNGASELLGMLNPLNWFS